VKRFGGVAGRTRREDGQVLILAVLALVVLIGFAGLVIDIGRVYVAQRQLQQSVDAAALAASQDLPDSASALVSATAYSAAPGNKNAPPGITANQPVVTFRCLTSLGITCNTDAGQCNAAHGLPNGCNAVKVTESARVNTTFLNVLGFTAFTSVSATSTSVMHGGTPHALDVAIVLDTTASMNSACLDANGAAYNVAGISSGNSTKIDCAKEGVRTLIRALWPCSPSLTSCGSATPLDEVGLYAFPALNSPGALTHDSTGSRTNVGLESGCPGSLSSKPSWYLPTGTSFPGWYLKSSDIGYTNANGYQLTWLSNDFRASDTASSLNVSSPLVDSVSWATCPGGNWPGNEYYGANSMGGAGTYIAGAITAAQNALASDSARHATPIMIVLSDGDASTKPAGSTNPCAEAVAAAASAKSAGTTVYSIAYDASTSTSSSCTKDSPATSGFATMSAIASTGKLYCMPVQAGCDDAKANSLKDLFQQIAVDVTNARLVSDDTN
jgi:Flp pilus assembly protein TadG